MDIKHKRKAVGLRRGKTLRTRDKEMRVKQIFARNRLGIMRCLHLMDLSRPLIRRLLKEFSRAVLHLKPQLAIAVLKSLDGFILGREMEQ